MRFVCHTVVLERVGICNVCRPPSVVVAMGRRLREAARSGSMSELWALLAEGAWVDAGDKDGVTALHLAAEEGREEAVRCLLEAGADVGARDGGQRSTPLHLAAHGGHAGVVQLLVAAQADLEARDVDERTPLHYAVLQGCVEAARSLLQAGASRSARDDDGRTPLGLAKHHKHEVLALLE